MPRVLILALALAASPAFSDCSQPADIKAQVAQASDQINAYRQAAGLGLLAFSDILTQTAQAHACDLAQMQANSHSGSNGADLVRRLKAQDYPFRSAVENVGKFGKTKAAAWWYGSASHRANLLSPKIKEIGLGVATGTDKQSYWVMVGGAQR